MARMAGVLVRAPGGRGGVQRSLAVTVAARNYRDCAGLLSLYPNQHNAANTGQKGDSMIALDINGRSHQVDADPETPLLW